MTAEDLLRQSGSSDASSFWIQYKESDAAGGIEDRCAGRSFFGLACCFEPFLALASFQLRATRRSVPPAQLRPALD